MVSVIIAIVRSACIVRFKMLVQNDLTLFVDLLGKSPEADSKGLEIGGAGGAGEAGKAEKPSHCFL